VTWYADAFLTGLRDGGRHPVTPAVARRLADCAGDALLLDLGAAYGFPVPLWLWEDADPACAAWTDPPARAVSTPAAIAV
jgi:hypothetical protein